VYLIDIKDSAADQREFRKLPGMPKLPKIAEIKIVELKIAEIGKGKAYVEEGPHPAVF
jgi:hypothetical protein